MSAFTAARIGAPALAPRRARLPTARRAPTLPPLRAVVTAEDVAAKLSGDDLGKWESCRSILVGELGMDEESADKTMIRAFGWGGQTYWRNAKVEEVPEVEDVEARIAFLLEIGIEQADIAEKVLWKVPEMLGCDVETRLRVNVEHITKNYFMKPNTKNFRNYINRVPQVLGNNLDCAAQGLNCAGECNRCWARC